MLYPQGKTVIGDLQTSFVNIDGILQELRHDKFTGYVKISYDDYDGLVIYEEGEPIESVEEYTDGRPRAEGAEAMTNVIAKTKEGGGVLNIQELPSNVVNMMLRAIHSKVVYKDLLSEFTQIKNLLVTLKTKQITGHVEIEMNDDAGEAFIFLEDGKLIESLFSSGDGTTYSGKKGLAKILEVANEVGYIMNVFQAKSKEVSRAAILEEPKGETVQAEDPSELMEVLENIVQSADQSLQKMMGKGKFVEAFLRALQEKSGDYPFLKSLAANITTGKGYVIDDTISDISDVVFGMSDVLDLGISFLCPTQKQKEKVKETVRIGLGLVKTTYGDLIQEYNLDTALFEYLG